MSAPCHSLLHTPWRQAELRFLLFHFATSRGLRVSLQNILVNITFLLTILKKVPEMSLFGSHAHVTPNENVVSLHVTVQFVNFNM